MQPGLITGASDGAPSGIATYSQVGARIGSTSGFCLLNKHLAGATMLRRMQTKGEPAE